MERVMSVEDRIKRAEEIYYRKKQNQTINNNYARVSIKSKKDYRVFKKMIIQIIVCLVIYFVFYYIVNNNYVFSEDFTNKAKEVLSHDIDLGQIYNNTSNYIKTFWKENKMIVVDNSQENKQNEVEVNSKENKEDSENVENTSEKVNQQEEQESEVKSEGEINEEQNTSVQDNENIGGAGEGTQELSQMEKDCIDIKNITSFIVPVQGYISSTFGWREPTTATVPKNHTGLDIAAVTGTEIKSATNGTVILASSQGDYGNHLKIQIEDVITVYAHCSVLCVKEGDYVVQGQKIAEVGSTGNSTGPHLHFEIRKSNRFVDPQMILDI